MYGTLQTGHLAPVVCRDVFVYLVAMADQIRLAGLCCTVDHRRDHADGEFFDPDGDALV